MSSFNLSSELVAHVVVVGLNARSSPRCRENCGDSTPRPSLLFLLSIDTMEFSSATAKFSFIWLFFKKLAFNKKAPAVHDVVVATNVPVLWTYCHFLFSTYVVEPGAK